MVNDDSETPSCKVMKEQWKVEARDSDGRVSASYHSTKDGAKASAANCRGRYPWGNRVRVVKVHPTPMPTEAQMKAALSGEKTIWNSDGTDGPCLICAPPKGGGA